MKKKRISGYIKTAFYYIPRNVHTKFQGLITLNFDRRIGLQTSNIQATSWLAQLVALLYVVYEKLLGICTPEAIIYLRVDSSTVVVIMCMLCFCHLRRTNT